MQDVEEDAARTVRHCARFLYVSLHGRCSLPHYRLKGTVSWPGVPGWMQPAAASFSLPPIFACCHVPDGHVRGPSAQICSDLLGFMSVFWVNPSTHVFYHCMGTDG